MDINLIEDKNQITDSDKLETLTYYFNQFKVGTLLNLSGTIKTKGLSPLCIFSILFNLAIAGFYSQISVPECFKHPPEPVSNMGYFCIIPNL